MSVLDLIKEEIKSKEGVFIELPKQKKFDIYISNTIQNKGNTTYKTQKEIYELKDLIDAVAYDNTGFLLKEYKRKKDNFISTNVLIADIDNADTENQEEWFDKEQINSTFGDYSFFAVPSKNHNIEKVDEKGNIHAKRPKWHLYFPLSKTFDNGVEFQNLYSLVVEHCPKLDKQLNDVARYIDGNKTNQFISDSFENVGKFIDEGFDYKSKKNKTLEVNHSSIWNKPENYIGVKEGERNTTLFKKGCSLYSKGHPKKDVMAFLEDINNTFKDSEGRLNPLTPSEMEVVFNSIFKYKEEDGFEASLINFDNAGMVFETTKEAFDFYNERFIIARNGTTGHLIYDKKTLLPRNNRKTFLEEYGGQFVLGKDKEGNSQVVRNADHKSAKVWFESTRKYAGVQYRPDVKTKVFIENNEVYINKFSGWKYEPKNHGYLSKPWFDFVKEVICKGSEARFVYLMDYVAHIFQYPEIKEKVHIAIGGKAGAGKGTFVETLIELAGRGVNAERVSNKEPLVDGYNSTYVDKIILFLDEATWAGDKASERALKQATEPTITRREKYEVERNVKNFIRVFMATNDNWRSPAVENDRRFFVLEVDDKYADNREYFKKLNQLMYINENVGRKDFFEDLLYQLMGRKVDDFLDRKVPLTREKIDDISRGRENDELYSWFRIVFIENEGILEGLKVNSVLEEPTRTDLVYDHFVNYCNKYHKKYIPKIDTFGRDLRRYFPKLEKVRMTVRGERKYYYNFNSTLEEAIENFNKAEFSTTEVI